MPFFVKSRTKKKREKFISMVPQIGSILSIIAFHWSNKCSVFQQMNSLMMWEAGIGLVVSDKKIFKYQPMRTHYGPWQPCWISNRQFSSFFLKPQNRYEPNLAEMFIGWSYTRFLFLALIGNPTWLPGPIICSDWSKF
jgi:hypothetical protein